jgi:predicted signal transduction protein with EAL and GGDEF domain
MSVCLELERIERQQLLTAVFQPLADLRLGNVFGYEGLIRGPQGTPWHNPMGAVRSGRAVWLFSVAGVTVPQGGGASLCGTTPAGQAVS